MAAVQIEHTKGNCKVTTLWDNPDNVAITPLEHYIVTLDQMQSFEEFHIVPANSTTLYIVLSLLTCDRNSVSVRAVDVCGNESPIITVTITQNKGECFITQESVCSASAVTTVTPSEITTTRGAANKPLQGR